MRAQQTRVDQLTAWVADLTGRDDVTLTRLPGGGRHEAWAVDAGGSQWFLRADSGPPSENEHYTLRREAEFYRAAHRTGVPCPAVLGVHPEYEAVLLDHAEGEAGFAQLDPVAQGQIIADFAPKLAQLHAADPADLDLPSQQPIRSIAEHTEAELDIWQKRLDHGGLPYPFLTACFAWLRANNPGVAGRPSLVQGDTGPGNFLHDGRQVTAFLDFELAHVGDPMTDLAWVGTRNAQEPVPDFAAFLEAYARAAGTKPDPARIRYHALFAELRIAVLGADRVAEGGGLMNDLGAQLIYGALHYRLTVEAFAAATGQELPSPELSPPADTAETRYFDGVILQMKDIIAPHVEDPFAARRLKNMARVLKHLREVDRVGGAHEVAELDELSTLLGAVPSSVEAGRRQLDQLVRAGERDAFDLLPYATARFSRQHQLSAPAMGVLATRHLPDFG